MWGLYNIKFYSINPKFWVYISLFRTVIFYIMPFYQDFYYYITLEKHLN